MIKKYLHTIKAELKVGFSLLRKRKWKEFKAYLAKNERFVSPLAIGIGFVVDSLTLTRIDQKFDNLILVTHLTIVGVMIILYASQNTRFGRKLSIEKYKIWVTILMQLSLGALFSGFTIFYTRSASLWSSWPFILILLGLLVGNELLREKYQKLQLQLSIYFVAVFSYFIFGVPLVVNKMGPWIFILSGITSLIFISVVIYLIYLIQKSLITSILRKLILYISGIFLAFNLLYFTNIIPPIPLSMKYLDVFHSVSRLPDGYALTYEKTAWYDIFDKRSNTLHSPSNVSIFSSVFAPTKLSTSIFHQWQYKNPRTGKWENHDRIHISISGGRGGGFRGYSTKSSLTNGKWRVRVVTSRNQEIGQVTFTVESGERRELDTVFR